MPQFRIVPPAGFSIWICSLLDYVDCITDILKVMVPNPFTVVVEGWLCNQCKVY